MGRSHCLNCPLGVSNLHKMLYTNFSSNKTMSDFTLEEINLIQDALLDSRIRWNNIIMDMIEGKRDNQYQEGAQFIRNDYCDLYNKVKQIKEEMV